MECEIEISFGNDYKPCEDLYLKEAKDLISLDIKRELNEKIQNLINNEFNGNFSNDFIDKKIKSLQLELNEITEWV